MTVKSIFCLVAIAAPVCVAGQSNKPQSLQPPLITPQRVSAPRTGSAGHQADAQRSPAPPAANPSFSPAGTPVRQASAPSAYAPGSRTAGSASQRKDLLVLPLLSGMPAALRSLSPTSLHEPPAVERDAQGGIAQPGGAQSGPSPDPNSRFLQPAPLLISQFVLPQLIQRAPETFITPIVLGFTEYASAPEPAADTGRQQPVGPTFNVLGGTSLAPGRYVFEPIQLESLALTELNYASATELRVKDPYFRIANTVMETPVIPWSVAAGNSKLPASQTSGFRMPRAIAALSNVNMNMGLGMPSFSPNLGAFSDGALGLGGVFDYLPPDVTDRLQPRYGQKPR